jgi:hypothetical protein
MTNLLDIERIKTEILIHTVFIPIKVSLFRSVCRDLCFAMQYKYCTVNLICKHAKVHSLKFHDQDQLILFCKLDSKQIL